MTHITTFSSQLYFLHDLARNFQEVYEPNEIAMSDFCQRQKVSENKGIIFQFKIFIKMSVS